MMKEFDPSALQTFQVATTDGVIEIEGYGHGQWAVTKRVGVDGWTITHLPSGMSIGNMGGIFPNAAAAYPAAVEIAALKRDWRDIPSHERKSLGIAVAEILKRHGGTSSSTPKAVAEKSRRAYRTDLNGCRNE